MNGKTVVVGVTGGIAAYKTCELVSLLKKNGANVFVVMTKNATEFVSPLTFETLSNNRVIVDMFDRDFPWEVEHISLAKKADIFVIAPCSANFAAKMANGIADDFLSTTILAVKCPVLIAPAMNSNMFNNVAYKKNENILLERGVKAIYGKSGRLACGDIGEGRMAEAIDIFNEINSILFAKQDFKDKTVLITAGATQEPIDPVRFISNYSSGKMGFELANAVSNRGGKVIFIYGNVSIIPKKSWELTQVKTTKEMFNAVMQNLDRADIIIKAAAPADYAVKNVESNKIKATKLTLELEKNPDIAKAVGLKKGNKKLIIFSAETNDLIENATKKLESKNADMVVANDVTKSGAGFNVDTNIVTLITKNKKTPLDIMPKSTLSDIILDNIMELIE